MEQTFNYTDEKFADLQLLRYRLPGFDALSLEQKKYIYYQEKLFVGFAEVILRVDEVLIQKVKSMLHIPVLISLMQIINVIIVALIVIGLKILLLKL